MSENPITSGLQTNSTTNINFILESANISPILSDIVLGISGEPIAGDLTDAKLIRCDISATDFHSVFVMRSESDGGDGTDIAEKDMHFKHEGGLSVTKVRCADDASTPCATGDGNFLCRLDKNDPLTEHGGDGDPTDYFHFGSVSYDAHNLADGTGRKLEADILRNCANHVFHTPHGIDLFANEHALLGNIQKIDTTAATALFADNDAGKTLGATTDFYDYANVSSGTTASDSVGATMFNTIANELPERFDPSGSNPNGYSQILKEANPASNTVITGINAAGGIPIPVRVGDKFYVQISLNLDSVKNPITGDTFGQDISNGAGSASTRYNSGNRNVYFLEITLV